MNKDFLRIQVTAVELGKEDRENVVIFYRSYDRFHPLSKSFSDRLTGNGMRGEKMYFELLLYALFGKREVLHAMECQICGYDEIYYNDSR